MSLARGFTIERIARIGALEMAAMIQRVPMARPLLCCHECQYPVLAGRVVGGRFLCDPCSAFAPTVTRVARVR